VQDAPSDVVSFGNVEREPAPFDPRFDRKLFVLNRPNAIFTDSARRRGIQGTVLVRVEFRADGTIGSIMVDNRLDISLAASAGQAARKIKFVPARIDGKPVTVFRLINYGFSVG
jgi:TonB family protein